MYISSPTALQKLEQAAAAGYQPAVLRLDAHRDKIRHQAEAEAERQRQFQEEARKQIEKERLANEAKRSEEERYRTKAEAERQRRLQDEALKQEQMRQAESEQHAAEASLREGKNFAKSKILHGYNFLPCPVAARSSLPRYSFWLGQTAIDNKLWSLIQQQPAPQDAEADKPVTGASWQDVQKLFIELESRNDKDAYEIPAGYEFRLPSEAEFACATAVHADLLPVTPDAATEAKSWLSYPRILAILATPFVAIYLALACAYAAGMQPPSETSGNHVGNFLITLFVGSLALFLVTPKNEALRKRIVGTWLVLQLFLSWPWVILVIGIVETALWFKHRKERIAAKNQPPSFEWRLEGRRRVANVGEDEDTGLTAIRLVIAPVHNDPQFDSLRQQEWQTLAANRQRAAIKLRLAWGAVIVLLLALSMGFFYKQRQNHKAEMQAFADLGDSSFKMQDYAMARAWYEKAAAQGNADAQTGLGIGLGVAQDFAQARAWFEKAAAQGNANAQTGLGILYHNGQGVTQDYGQARAWYEKAAAQGNALAQSNLGILYEYGQGVTQDYGQARAWFEKAAAQGDDLAQYNLGALYHIGQGVTQDYGQARAWYEKAGAQGNAWAQLNLGILYDWGLGVAQDYVQARAWYEKAAAQGNADAQNYLGFLYHNGQGVAQDYRQARLWYEKAAAQGHAKSQCNLGLLYENGQGVDQDFIQARRWYEKSAAQGRALAQYKLGTLYDNGQGVMRNYDQARGWYEKAASQGSADAQTQLGLLYNLGRGVTLDFGQARIWYEKAASQGYAWAQYNLGTLYENGQGVTQDYVQARAWYEKAAAQGISSAQERLKTLPR